jgi:hypothetical protein
MFKQSNNEESWRFMYQEAANKEQLYFNRCFNFVSINREDAKLNQADIIRKEQKGKIHPASTKITDQLAHGESLDIRDDLVKSGNKIIENKKRVDSPDLYSEKEIEI